MATFNPDVQPVQEQTYNNYFHPVDKTPANKSGELLFGGIGQELGDIGKIIPQATTLKKDLIEKDASEKIFQQADAESENRIKSLEATAKILSPNEGSYVTTPYGENNITGSTGADTPKPPAISELPSQMDALVNLRNNGKISETEYKKRLYLFAKQTRAAYGPQFRDYIDDTIAKATGERNPANAYASSLISDINARASKQADDKTKIENLIIEQSKEGNPAASGTFKAWKAGIMSDQDVFDWNTKANKDKWDYNNARRQLDRGDIDRTVQERNSTDFITNHVYKTATNFFSNINTQTGVTTPAEAVRRVDAIMNGKGTVSEEDAQQLYQVIDSLKKTSKAMAWKDLNSPGANGEPSPVQTVGMEKARKLVETGNDAVFNDILDSIGNKDWGAAYRSIHTAEAMQNDNTLRVLKTKDLGQALLNMNTANKLIGSNNPLMQDLTRQWIQSGLGNVWTEFLKQNTASAVTIGPKIWQSGNSPSLKEDVSRAEENNAPPITYQQTTELPGQILKSKASDEAKISMARYAFGPKNAGLVSKFAKDTEVNDSQYSLYGYLYSDNVTKEMARLRGTGSDGMQAWSMYKDSAERTFGTELFRKDLANLNSFPGPTQGLQIGWDDKKHEILVNDIGKPTADPMLQRERDMRMRNLTKVTDRINSGISRLKTIYESEGKDVNQYLIQELQNNNVDVSQWTGLPKAISDSILFQRQNAERAKEGMKRKNQKNGN